MKKKFSRIICFALILCISMAFVGILSPKSLCYYDTHCHGGWVYEPDYYAEGVEGCLGVSLCNGYHHGLSNEKTHGVLKCDLVAPVVYYKSTDTGEVYVGDVIVNCKDLADESPTGITVTKASDFYVKYCNNLKTVNVVEIVKHYEGDDCEIYIANCPKLTELNLSTGRTFEIENCDGLKKVVINNPENDGLTLTIKDCDSLEEVIIQSHIDKLNFQNCPNLKKVSMPDSVLGYDFRNDTGWNSCLGLVSVKVSGIDIPQSAFEDCEKLEEAIIPEGVSRIGGYAFRNCAALDSINIPSSVTVIGSQAFRFGGTSDVYFAGTKAEWKNVLHYGDVFDKGTVVHCSDGIYDLCSCNCHKGGFFEWIYEIICAIMELFGLDYNCSCGNAHR